MLKELQVYMSVCVRERVCLYKIHLILRGGTIIIFI